MLDMHIREVATNLLSTHSHKADEARLELFMSLKILDRHGRLSCMWQEDKTRCSSPLVDINSALICNAFQEFFWIVEDPLYKDDDPQLLKCLRTFLHHTLCEKHQTRRGEWTILCLGRLRAWRHSYVWNRFQSRDRKKVTTPTRSDSRLMDMVRSSSQRLRAASKPSDDRPTSPTAANLWGILGRRKTRAKSKRDSLGAALSPGSVQDEDLKRRAEARSRLRFGLGADMLLDEDEAGASAARRSRDGEDDGHDSAVVEEEEV